MTASLRDAYNLIHQGTLALAEVEAAGMRIDVDRLDRTIEKATKRIDRLTKRLQSQEPWELWRHRWRDKASLGSRQQFAQVLFEQMGFESDKRTKKSGKPKMDIEVLEKIDHPFVRDWVKLQKTIKLRSTNLVGLKREVVDGFVRPSFNLHLPVTYRSSVDHPNSQNVPNRDEDLARPVRRCFIPRDGHVLVEADYSALEFKGVVCLFRDKEMLRYASDPTLDIHRDMAAECYQLPVDEVSKRVRFNAKNKFVFPTLYGSYYVNCSKNLWQAIEAEGLETNDGVSLYDHLKSMGIKRLGACNPKVKPIKGTFEHHIQRVEKRFNKRFPEWSKRKYEWWDKYEAKGSFKMMTGFECAGVFSHNDLYNWPIQGPSFHLLLWSLIQMVKWIRKRKMKTRIIGQIHDSIIGDVHRDELDVFLKKLKQVMTVDVRRRFNWVCVPLEIECEIAEDNWFEKKEIPI